MLAVDAALVVGEIMAMCFPFFEVVLVVMRCGWQEEDAEQGTPTVS
jgi:hypothetical protein